jgi:nicotinate-nucleotide adenylyltransferase
VNRGAAPPRPRRFGLLGGSFDPPHLGHLAFAEWARVQLDLEGVLFMPAGDPPHKRRARMTEARHRLAMTRLAVRGNPAFAVSDLEVRRNGPSYTVDTLRALTAAHPRRAWVLLMGADAFTGFGTWRDPEGILARAQLAVALRPGARRPRAGRWTRTGAGVTFLDNPGLEVSSTALRDRARAGLSLRYLVPEAVARHITRHALYRRAS